jgi:hypothetical protein
VDICPKIPILLRSLFRGLIEGEIRGIQEKIREHEATIARMERDKETFVASIQKYGTIIGEESMEYKAVGRDLDYFVAKQHDGDLEEIEKIEERYRATKGGV